MSDFLNIEKDFRLIEYSKYLTEYKFIPWVATARAFPVGTVCGGTFTAGSAVGRCWAGCKVFQLDVQQRIVVIGIVF